MTGLLAPKTDIPGGLHVGLSVLAGALVLGLWCWLSYGGVVRPDFLAPPHQVVLAGWKGLTRGSLLGHIWSSVVVIFSGFLLASVLAVPLGILMGSFKVVEALIEPITGFMRYLPVSAMIPLLILWIGIGIEQKIAVIFLGTFFQQLVLIADVSARVSKDLIDVSYTLGASRRQVVTRVLFPACLPGVMDNLRVTMGWAWTYLVVAELVAGLERPTSGAITLDGRAITGPSAERGMVFQSYTLFPWLTVRRNVEFGPELRGRPAAERRRIALAFIRQVGLDGFEEAHPDQLSGGMRQRAALARALANDPEILLMDEPFGALDSQTRALMQEMLLGIWEQSHKTVLFVTHDIDEALFLGDVVYVMSARPGRIKEEIAVDIPRPRSLDVLTAPEFALLKRRVLGLIREEAMRALADA